MSDQIKTSRQARLLGHLAGFLARLLGLTLRCRFTDPADLKNHPSPLILILWHNRVLSTPYLWQKFLPERRAVVLTSASRDGATLATAVKSFGLDSVRGSSSRRGAAALVALRKAVRAGNDVCITPDGPKGPRYDLKPGALKLAQATGSQLAEVRVTAEKFYALKTWDQFQIPKPFSKIHLSLHPLPPVPEDESSFENYRLEIQNRLAK